MTKLVLSCLIKLVPYLHRFHSPSNKVFIIFRKLILLMLKKYKIVNKKEICFFPYNFNGNLKWPLKQFGNLDSYCYFDLQEIILHSFYFINRNKYKFAIDFGTNIGIDAIVLASFGIKTFAYEPDKDLLSFAKKSKKLNKLKNLELYPFGILDKNKKQKFIKVLNNLNASHVKGARSFYGKYKEIICEFKSFDYMKIKEIPNLIKINIEGSESKVVPTIPLKVWKKADVFIEVHDKKNRDKLWSFFLKNKLNVFSQKKNWKRCEKIDQLPLSNKEGYIFVSTKNEMKWF